MEDKSIEQQIWKAQAGPQELLIKCHIQEIFYGGARGGGKTDGALGHWLYHSLEWEKLAKGLFIRRTMPELEGVISRAKELFEDIAEWKEQKKTFYFNNGAVLKFRFIERDAHADKYQGHEYSWICIEEAGTFSSPVPIDKLRGTLRSSGGAQTWFLLTGNPGGSGHNWLKTRYIDPSLPLRPFEAHTKLPSGQIITTKRIFIPSKVSDNTLLMTNDPNYVNNIVLAAAGQPWLLDAWLDGNWNIVCGGMFDDLYREERHILPEFKVPPTWSIYRSYDWGSSKPFSIGWWAISDGGQVKIGNQYRSFPTGSLIRVDEWYGWNGNPNQGLNMLESDIAQHIVEHELKMGWEVNSGPADPMIFNETNGGSIADFHYEKGVTWIPADKGLRVTGWQQMRQLLAESAKDRPENAGMWICENCTQWRRTVPTLPRSTAVIDDCNSDAEDHIGDETRYMVRFKPQLVSEHTLGGT